MFKIISDTTAVDAESLKRTRQIVLEDRLGFCFSAIYTNDKLTQITLIHYVHPALATEEVGKYTCRLAEVHWNITPDLYSNVWLCGFEVPYQRDGELIGNKPISFDEYVEENPGRFASKYITALIQYRNELPSLFAEFETDDQFYSKMLMDLRYIFPLQNQIEHDE